MSESEQVGLLFRRLVQSQTNIGRLEAQNEILKVKLRLALQQLQESEGPQSEMILQLPGKSRSDDSFGSVEADMSPFKLMDGEHAQTPKVDELTTALHNLKKGFKRREATLREQLEQHKSALYALYAAHVKVKGQLKELCGALCMQMDNVEKLGQQGSEHSDLLMSREEDVLSIQSQLHEAFHLLQEMSGRPSPLKPAVPVEEDERSAGSDARWRQEMTQFTVRDEEQEGEQYEEEDEQEELGEHGGDHCSDVFEDEDREEHDEISQSNEDDDEDSLFISPEHAGPAHDRCSPLQSTSHSEEGDHSELLDEQRYAYDEVEEIADHPIARRLSLDTHSAVTTHEEAITPPLDAVVAQRVAQLQAQRTARESLAKPLDEVLVGVSVVKEVVKVEERLAVPSAGRMKVVPSTALPAMARRGVSAPVVHPMTPPHAGLKHGPASLSTALGMRPVPVVEEVDDALEDDLITSSVYALPLPPAPSPAIKVQAQEMMSDGELSEIYNDLHTSPLTVDEEEHEDPLDDAVLDRSDLLNTLLGTYSDDDEDDEEMEVVEEYRDEDDGLPVEGLEGLSSEESQEEDDSVADLPQAHQEAVENQSIEDLPSAPIPSKPSPPAAEAAPMAARAPEPMPSSVAAVQITTPVVESTIPSVFAAQPVLQMPVEVPASSHPIASSIPTTPITPVAPVPSSASAIVTEYQSHLIALQERDAIYMQNMESVQYDLGEKLYLLNADLQAKLKKVADERERSIQKVAEMKRTPLLKRKAFAIEEPPVVDGFYSSPINKSHGLSYETQLTIAQERIVNLSTVKDKLEKEIKSLRMAFDGQNQAKMHKIMSLQTEKEELLEELGKQYKKQEQASKVDKACQVMGDEFAVLPITASGLADRAKAAASVGYSSVPLINEVMPDMSIKDTPKADADDELSRLLFTEPTKPKQRTSNSTVGHARANGSHEEKRAEAAPADDYESFLDGELQAMDEHLQSLVSPVPARLPITAPRSSSPQEEGDEDFDNVRVHWELQQLTKKHEDLQEAHKKLSRELELYKTKIFTVISQDTYKSINMLPDINLSYSLYNGRGQDIINYNDSEAYQSLYILNTLVENNNNHCKLIDQLTADKARLTETNHRLTGDLDFYRQDCQDKDDKVAKLKLLLSQASSTISFSGEDYHVMQKQVQILTKKLQLLMLENQQLAAASSSSTGMGMGMGMVSTGSNKRR